MTYQETEKRQARRRLRAICDAIAGFPEEIDPVLAGTDLLELLRLAEFAGRELRVAIPPLRVGNSPN